ncbi:MAG TPA: nucleotidyltransferase family protein [Magnetospirillum sp.]|jgi:MurNAc alpha-1-phosphate uridylyltransferase|nr:nucleotidyltransferase family protein [Magnetospirillum sp.]
MSIHPTHAMVLAAGLGLRMRPITEHTPKPLVEVAGRTMLDRALDHLAVAGASHLVVNTHWLADRIVTHLSGRPGITLSHEEVLLETGGGVAKALPHLGTAPFFVVNSDIIWTDGGAPALKRLAEAFDESKMDALLLLQPTATAMGYEGKGDFFLDARGTPRRRRDPEVAPLLFSGVQILTPRLFRDAPPGKFSLNVLYDRALEEGRLFGIVHDGRWYHVGTPEALPEVEQAIEAQ